MMMDILYVYLFSVANDLFMNSSLSSSLVDDRRCMVYVLMTIDTTLFQKDIVSIIFLYQFLLFEYQASPKIPRAL